jgi:hypothetical protein
MATKQDIISGIEMLIREGHRIADTLGDDDWKKAEDPEGWKSEQVLAHVAGIGTMVVPLATGMLNAPSGANVAGSFDIDQVNAGVVAARAGKTPKELAAELDSAYRGVIEWIKAQPDDALNQPRTFNGYVEVPAGDIMMRVVVLHGLAHIYGAYNAVMLSGAAAPA